MRRHDGLLRWTLDASTPDLETVVYADTTTAGTVVFLQSDEYVSTAGDPELDELVIEQIKAAVAGRYVSRRLDDLDRPRRRSDRLRWAA